jgi:hypothetical protein
MLDQSSIRATTKKKPTKKAGLYRKKIKRNRQKVGEQMGEQ